MSPSLIKIIYTVIYKNILVDNQVVQRTIEQVYLDTGGEVRAYADTNVKLIDLKSNSEYNLAYFRKKAVDLFCPSAPLKVDDTEDTGFMQSLVNAMETLLVQPEDTIIRQGRKEGADYLYFIMQGDCIVNIRDTQGKEHEAYKLLTEGDHFGEISLLYGCPVTASVIAMNYNTFGVVSER